MSDDSPELLDTVAPTTYAGYLDSGITQCCEGTVKNTKRNPMFSRKCCENKNADTAYITGSTEF